MVHLVYKHTHTCTHTRQDSSERVIRPLLWPLAIQRSKQKAIHALSGIRTYDQSKRAPTVLRLSLHGQRDWVFVISDFRRAVYENCVLLGHYPASSGNLLPTRLHNLAVLSLELRFNKKASNQPTKDLRAETWAKRKSTSLGLYSHSCVNRLAGSVRNT